MNTAGSESAVVVEHVEPAVTEAPVARDYEAEARKAGWKSEAEFPEGKRPVNFVDAETFVKKAEELAPFIRKENKQLRKELDALKKDIDTRVGKLTSVARTGYEREVANYEREIARLKGEQVKAVEAGDVDGFKALDKEIGKVPVPEKVDVPGKDAEAVAQADIEAKFKETNPWYGEDEALTAYAQGHSLKLAKDSMDTLPIEQNMKLVEAHMRKLFPEHYKAKPNGNGHANVDGGSDFSAPGKSDPMLKYGNAEREQCAIDMKTFPKAFPTKAAWIAAYEGKK